MKKISIRQICEIIIWIVSYFPIFLITLYRSWETQNMKIAKNTYLVIKDIHINVSVVSFISIFIVTIVLYRATFYTFFKMIKKTIQKDNSNQKLKIKTLKKLSLNEYSFFILSLMLPFIFETVNSTFDILILISLIFILIFIMVKMKQIIVNPIFLFSGVKILQAEITKGNDLDTIECAIITKLTSEELETEDFFYYEEYFSNVFFLTLKK